MSVCWGGGEGMFLVHGLVVGGVGGGGGGPNQSTLINSYLEKL